MRLRFLHDLSLEDTATALGKAPNAIKQTQLRAVRALRRVAGVAVALILGWVAARGYFTHQVEINPVISERIETPDVPTPLPGDDVEVTDGAELRVDNPEAELEEVDGEDLTSEDLTPEDAGAEDVSNEVPQQPTGEESAPSQFTLGDSLNIEPQDGASDAVDGLASEDGGGGSFDADSFRFGDAFEGQPAPIAPPTPTPTSLPEPLPGDESGESGAPLRQPAPRVKRLSKPNPGQRPRAAVWHNGPNRTGAGWPDSDGGS